jgi:hypothetical protein
VCVCVCVCVCVPCTYVGMKQNCETLEKSSAQTSFRLYPVSSQKKTATVSVIALVDLIAQNPIELFLFIVERQVQQQTSSLAFLQYIT